MTSQLSLWWFFAKHTYVGGPLSVFCGHLSSCTFPVRSVHWAGTFDPANPSVLMVLGQTLNGCCPWLLPTAVKAPGPPLLSPPGYFNYIPPDIFQWSGVRHFLDGLHCSTFVGKSVVVEESHPSPAGSPSPGAGYLMHLALTQPIRQSCLLTTHLTRGGVRSLLLQGLSGPFHWLSYCFHHNKLCILIWHEWCTSHPYL